MTKKSYYERTYDTAWSATVASIEPYKNQWGTRLEETLCYPEGGGQPGDRGMIGTSEVVDTIKHEGDILHITGEKPGYSAGDTLECSLDWEHRYDYMQQHTGQHIISGVMYDALSIDTVSVHQGEEYTTIEIVREEIRPEEIEQIELLANAVITRNLPIHADEKMDHELDAASLRRAPKVSGKIRLVTIEECDVVACGGLHTERTGEVGLISCIGTETIRGRLRLIFKIGERAYRDYREKNRVTGELGTLFSAKLQELTRAARQKSEQVKDLQAQVTALEKELALQLIAQEFSSGMTYNNILVTAVDLSDRPAGILKTISKNLPEGKDYYLCMVQENGDGKLQWLIAAGGAAGIDFPTVRNELFPLIGAKGGGRPPVWQGIGDRPDGKDAFLAAFRKMVIPS